MEQKSKIELANSSLDRILSFFPRVEGKASFLFAMDTGLLALMALNAKAEDFFRWYITLPAAIATALLLGSLYFVYSCMFPQLKGGAESLVYFRAIAQRTEAHFIDLVLKQDHDSHVRDVLAQVWRNSEILRSKFDAMKIAFILSALALVPWCLFLARVAATHPQNLIFK